MTKRFHFFLLGLLIFCFSCKDSNKEIDDSKKSIRFIDKVSIKNDQLIDSTLVGGLSSIDFIEGYRYVLISDDRSEYSPARIYEMSIQFDTAGFHHFNFIETTFLKNKNGAVFEKNELDAESIRYRARTNSFIYTSEGGRTYDGIKPFIREMNQSGMFLADVKVPDIFAFKDGKGLRDNGAFESLTLENDSIIWYTNELPLIEDGEVPSFEDAPYPIRLVRQNIKNNEVLNQYVYLISPTEEKPIPSEGFYINSVPEMLYIDQNTLWVIERAYSEGVGNFVKVFEVKTEEATDVKGSKALTNIKYQAVSKKLILDFSDFNQKIDNIEGMTFGPDFPNGDKSLLFISDDNFSKLQETQLWLFAVSDI